jgi:phage head maturation protease
MTDDLRTIEAGDVAIREDSEGDGRTIHGYAYRWGELTPAGSTAEYGALAEGFAKGAFAPAIAARGERPWPYLDRHRGRVIAGVRFAEDEIGLRYEGRLLNTQAARDYAEEVAAAPGVSLEFMYRGAKSRREGKTIIHTAIPKIAALAGAYAPAYEGASVALRDTGGIMDTTETTTEPIAERAVVAEAGPVFITAEQARGLALDAATEIMRAYAERGTLTVSEADPLAGYRTLGELYLAAAQRDAEPELRAYAARALADTVFTSGANAGLASGNLVTQDIKRIVNAGRPAITAFGGPKSIGDVAGLTLSWPYYDGTLADHVAAQSAEKAEIESAAIDIKLATEALVTYAGGSDISYQIIKRGSPSVLDAFARIVLAAWAAVTDAAFVTELETGTVNVDLAEAISAVDLTELTAHLITASLAVEAATGVPAQFALASTTAFTKAANLIAPSSTVVVAAGGMDLRGMKINLGGLPIIHVPGVTAGKFIASNELAAGWYEDGPFQASAEDVAKLGRNVAYWSMGAGARFVPAGIVEIFDVTP